ncbi:MAG: hypothetical protein R3B96_09160 [Pirellulaceae bacterium]
MDWMFRFGRKISSTRLARQTFPEFSRRSAAAPETRFPLAFTGYSPSAERCGMNRLVRYQPVERLLLSRHFTEGQASR